MRSTEAPLPDPPHETGRPDTHPWAPPRRASLLGDGVQAWIYVLAPVAVAIASAIVLGHVAHSSGTLLAHGELVGRLRFCSADLEGQLGEVAAGGTLDRSTLATDLAQMESVLADAGALRTNPEWAAQSASAAGSRHMEDLLRRWPEVREALLAGAADDAGAARVEHRADRAALRALARGQARTFARDAGRFADDLLSFCRAEERDHERRIRGLLGLLVVALLAGAGLRAYDLLRLRRREREVRRLSLVARSTSHSVLLADADGCARWANDAFLRTTGWESVRGRGLLELLSAGPGDDAGAALSRAIAERTQHHGEYELSRQDGGRFWAGVELMPLGEADSEHQFMLMFADITPRVHATRDLAASNGRFRSALSAMSEGFVLLDANGTIVQCNEAAQRIFGVPEEHLLHSTPSTRRLQFFHEDGRPVTPDERPFAVARRSARPLRDLVQGLDKAGGERVWLSFDASEFTLPGSDRPGVVLTFTDITARRAAEQSVRAMTQVVEQSPTMVLLTGADNRIEYVNRAFEECTGFAMADIRGRAPSFMLSEQTPAETWDSLGKALAEGQYWRGEIHNTARDGSGWLSDSQVFALRDGAGVVTHYVALMRDITEERRRERELSEAREAALAAAQAKSEFLNNVSHELRTPLNGIMGLSELLLNSPLDASQRADLVQLRRSADDLLTVVTHLFDFVQADSSAAEAASTPFRLRASLAEIEGSLAAGAASRGLRWNATVDAAVPDGLVGDPGRLRRVLFNLTDNAVKFTERGEVALSIGIVRLTDDSATLRFAVRDTGIGIRPERQATIFEAFEQGDGSNARRYGGIGLGLALASRLVRQMGGNLAVESRHNEGSTFHFELVLGRSAADATMSSSASGAVDAPAPDARLAGVLVLVAAGPAGLRAGTRAALEGAGATVPDACGAANAAGALARLAAEGCPATALVIDQRADGLDGFALVEALQAAGVQLPACVLVTAAGRRGDAERCRRLGIAGYLAAPAGDAELVETVRQLRAPQADGTPALVTRHLLREARRRHRVLVVDDNAVNRKVASRLLERAGYEVDTAVDGREAVDRFVAGGWDAVLMDVQMPGMDGIEATRLIREHERARGLARTPVLALTAHALDADRRIVLEAGMDELVSKPIQPDALTAVLQRFLALAPTPAWADAAAPELADVIDRDEALERMDGDTELLEELLRIFRGDAASMLQRLEAAVASGEAHPLERAAHSLKGASATISAKHVSALAAEVERRAREGQLQEALDRMDDLRREFGQLVRALESVPQREAA